MTKIFSLQGGKKLEGKTKRWMKGRLTREYSWIKRKKKSYLCCMNMSAALKVSQEDGILTKWTNIYLENVI